MSEKFEFGDLYKFITSVGLVMTGSALALPWIFLREQFDLTLSKETLGGLPPESQALLSQKMHLISLVFRYLPTVSLSLLIFGIAVFLAGCFMWWSRQQWRDRAENAKTKGAEQRLETMTKPEVEASTLIKLEASDTTAESTSQTERTTSRSGSVTSYIEMEERVGERLASCFDRTHYVLPHQRLGAAEFDFVLQDKNTGRKDAIIELKVRSSPANTSWVLDSVRQAALGAQAYIAATRKQAMPILLIVVPGPAQPAEGLIERAKKIANTDSSLSAVLIVVFREGDFFTADCRELRQHLGMQ